MKILFQRIKEKKKRIFKNITFIIIHDTQREQIKKQYNYYFYTLRRNSLKI